jgi:4-hydroxy-3-methylbut-2-enyl diphosphate reductase
MAERFADAASPGFDFERHLERVGVANQTTMLSSESLEIAGMIRQAMLGRYGEAELGHRFRSFDTICSATQERQDAVVEMMADPPDLMLVIGGYNSSNTHHLAEIASRHCPTYHIEDAREMISSDRIRHKPAAIGAPPEMADGWLPPQRPLTVGLTAGASTPNRVIGDVIGRLLELTGNANERDAGR